jgi:monoamine oxidase
VTVGVVGLGIAGMRAAMLLERAGADVRLFEARSRLGGRMETAQHGDAIYEAGGEWIDGDHVRVLGLLHELGLKPEPPPDFPRHFLFEGSRCTTEDFWEDALQDELRLEAVAREHCRNLRQPPWANTHLPHLDRLTLADLIAESAKSERGRWWLRATSVSDEGDDPECVGLLGWLAGYLHYLGRQGGEMSAYRLPRGARTLFERIGQSLRTEPQLGRTLQRVTQDPGGVTLKFDDGEERVDRVVLTLPPPALEKVAFDPAISVQRRCALEAARMSRSIKISMEFDRAWWLDEGWGGSMQMDRPLQQIWDATQGGSPVLTAYICGGQADRWLAIDDPVAAAFAELGDLFPASKDHAKRGWLHDWVSDPMCRGGFSYLPPGFVLEHMEHLSTPEGRIHFAGEHTALWTGFIEGALESAERVVGEIATA